MMAKNWSGAQRLCLVLIMAVYIGMGISYALSTPPLEASDEFKHYPVVQHIQTELELPVLDPDQPGLWRQEAVQPPLYYAVMALLTSWIDTSDLPALYYMNPHAFIGQPDQVGNKNLLIHDPIREAFPWKGPILAIYMIRFASIALGIGSLMLTALMGRDLLSHWVGVLATALTAFNPMFLFVSSAVNNDSLAVLLGQLGLFLLVRVWQQTPDPRRQWDKYAVLGAVLGLGIVTKISLAGLLALAGLMLAWRAWRQKSWSHLLVGGGVTLLVALSISGWWFIRNWHVYGDPTGLEPFIAVQGIRPSPMTWSDWQGEFGTFFRTYWGLFGAVNIAAPQIFYWACNIAVLVGLAGLATRFASTPTPLWRGGWLLAIWPTMLFGLLLRWTTVYYSFQGRLIFPALGGLNVLWAAGLLSWSGKRGSSLALIIVPWMLGASMLLPWLTIRPAYAEPQPLLSIPSSARFGPITFTQGDDQIQLIGAEIPADQGVNSAGAPVTVTLYWQARRPVERDYVSTIHLLGRQATSVGQVNRFPAQGMNPTSRWSPSEIWQDLYHVYVDKTAQAPTRLQVDVGLYDPGLRLPLTATGPDGSPMDLVVVGEAVLRADDQAPQPEPPIAANYLWDDGISLVGYEFMEEQLQLILYWQATDRPSRNYTIFVHLIGQAEAIAGQGDGPPLAGDDVTSLWIPGDLVVDAHTISLSPELPPGPFDLAIGLYYPPDGTRLSVQDATGIPLPGQRVILPLSIQLDQPREGRSQLGLPKSAAVAGQHGSAAW